jgi:hypothetical protein
MTGHCPVELRQLKHFIAVIDSGTVSVAARKLNMSQSALTTSIKTLERSVGTSLLTPTKQGIFRIVNAPEPKHDFAVGVIFRRGVAPNANARKFRDVVRSVCREGATTKGWAGKSAEKK